jgi:hypothetical protein
VKCFYVELDCERGRNVSDITNTNSFVERSGCKHFKKHKNETKTNQTITIRLTGCDGGVPDDALDLCVVQPEECGAAELGQIPQTHGRVGTARGKHVRLQLQRRQTNIAKTKEQQ